MSTAKIILLSAVLSAACAQAGSEPVAPEVNASSAAGISPAGTAVVAWPQERNSAFSPGELLRFNIRWGLVGVGAAEMGVNGVENLNGRDAYHILVTAKSHPFFDTFYKVRNRDETWIDTQSLCCLKVEKHQQEGGFRKESMVLFDHVNRRYRMSETNDAGVTSNAEGDITPFIQDALSALYRIRSYTLEIGKEYFLDAFSQDRIYPLKVCVYKKERVKVPAGKFDCILIEPFLAGDGLFKASGRLWIWVTDDDRKMPVLMKSKILVGNITAELKEYK